MTSTGSIHLQRNTNLLKVIVAIQAEAMMTRKITLADISEHDMTLIALLVFRLKEEGVIGQTYKPEDFLDIILKRGDYEGKAK
jgi:hypothetical protein